MIWVKSTLQFIKITIAIMMAKNAMAIIIVSTIHTLTSLILHSIHNQGIFIEFPVLPLLLPEGRTLLP